MKKPAKIFTGLAIVAILLFIAFTILTYIFLNNSLPEYSGEKKVKGIKAEAEVYRDKYAVPYIKAANEEDAAFILGYVHAQERLFQMDLSRRAGLGTLSEILGRDAVPFDKMFRTVGIKRICQMHYDSLSVYTKKMLTAYSAGVNSYIREKKGSYQLEFDALGYDPEEWKPLHSLVIAKMIAWQLNISWWSDVALAHLVQELGAEKVRGIVPNYDSYPTIIPDSLEKTAAISTELRETDKLFRNFIGFKGTHIGSNNWAVAPGKSKSGKPVIANDPHLSHEIPGKWFTAVIEGGDWKASGFTIPGAPGIVIGKNDSIAWTVTNVMADDSDFYIEKLDSSETSYLLDGNWVPLKILKDTISVKDSGEVLINVKLTHRGPIISDIHAFNILFPDSSEKDYADISMRWTAMEFSDELLAVMDVNKSRNPREFEAALRNYKTPGQNFVYADVNGNIGYICAARLPIRNQVSNTLVYDGTKSASDWKGFVPYTEMPKIFNPDQEFIATANNRVSDKFQYYITNIWEPASRIDRITQFLKSKEKHGISDFKKLQMSFYSHYAKKINSYLLKAFVGVNITDENLETTLDLMKNWNYEMDKFSQPPAIYAVFFQRLLHNTYEDEMGERGFNEFTIVANLPYRSILQLLKKENDVWFDNVNTGERESRDIIIRKSLSEALDTLESKFGKDPALWQWGELHKVTFKHIFARSNKFLAPVLNRGPYNIGGDGTTVFNTEYAFRNPYDNVLGPSMRFLADFAEPDAFYMILPNGQSGNFFSRHYDDMTEMWLKGDYIKVNTEFDSVKNKAWDLLKFIPN